MAASDYMPTTYQNCIDARLWACKHLRELAPSMFGDLQVYLNDDLNNQALLDENQATAEGGSTENGSE